jgi:Phosphorylase superfamily
MSSISSPRCAGRSSTGRVPPGGLAAACRPLPPSTGDTLAMDTRPDAGPVAFICAMPMELRPLARKLTLHRAQIGDVRLHSGTLGGRAVVAVVTGIGPKRATAGTKRVLDAVDVDHVVVVGITGAVENITPIGTLILPEVVVNGATRPAFRAWSGWPEGPSWPQRPRPPLRSAPGRTPKRPFPARRFLMPAGPYRGSVSQVSSRFADLDGGANISSNRPSAVPRRSRGSSLSVGPRARIRTRDPRPSRAAPSPGRREGVEPLPVPGGRPAQSRVDRPPRR